MNAVAIRPIRNEEDYRAALAEIDSMIDAEAGSAVLDAGEEPGA